jgi:NhaA family Na+:H+ antiporter
MQSGLHATIEGVALGLATRSNPQEDTGPAEQWEHLWRPVSAAIAVPVFALLAAGVEISPQTLVGMLHEPLVLGIVIGLVVGKTIGVFGGAYLTARFTRAELAPDLRWSEVFSVSILGGVGFTVALLVSDLAFGSGSEAAEHGKMAVLLGSLLAATIAVISLSRRNTSRRRQDEADHDQPVGTAARREGGEPLGSDEVQM